jgi:hypothetical protein
MPRGCNIGSHCEIRVHPTTCAARNFTVDQHEFSSSPGHQAHDLILKHFLGLHLCGARGEPYVAATPRHFED